MKIQAFIAFGYMAGASFDGCFCCLHIDLIRDGRYLIYDTPVYILVCPTPAFPDYLAALVAFINSTYILLVYIQSHTGACRIANNYLNDHGLSEVGISGKAR